MAERITIRFSSSHCKPPVYIVGSWAQWEPSDMAVASEKTSSGDLIFYKDLSLEPGEHQYKFRLGPGDWWALDETAEKTTDDAGNHNNVIVVKRNRKASSASAPSGQAHGASDNTSEPAVKAPERDRAPLFQHESHEVRAEAPLFPREQPRNDDDEIGDLLRRQETQHGAPLFSHECASDDNLARSPSGSTTRKNSQFTAQLEEEEVSFPSLDDDVAWNSFQKPAQSPSTRPRQSSLPEPDPKLDVIKETDADVEEDPDNSSPHSLDGQIEIHNGPTMADEHQDKQAHADPEADHSPIKLTQPPDVPLTPPLTPTEESKPTPLSNSSSGVKDQTSSEVHDTRSTSREIVNEADKDGSIAGAEHKTSAQTFISAFSSAYEKLSDDHHRIFIFTASAVAVIVALAAVTYSMPLGAVET